MEVVDEGEEIEDGERIEGWRRRDFLAGVLEVGGEGGCGSCGEGGRAASWKGSLGGVVPSQGKK